MPLVCIKSTLDADALLAAARINDTDDRERFLELVHEAEGMAGAAVYESRAVEAIDGDDITIGGVTFAARPLSRLLRQGMAVYPYVATCGVKMADYGKTLSDPLEQYWWDLIMIHAVGGARRDMQDAIEGATGQKLKSVNPGSLQMWPISNMPALFSLIGDVEQMIGVTIAPSFLMIPLKSVSGIFFSDGGAFTHNCCLCERQNCPNRRVEFDPALKGIFEGEH